MDIAISPAASVAVESMAKSDNSPNSSTATARSLTAAIPPALGISWNIDILKAVTPDTINKLTSKLRDYPLRRLRYDKLAALGMVALHSPYSLLPEWGEWKQPADAFMLGRRFPQETIAKTITSLSARSVPGTGELAILDAGAIETMAVTAPSAGPLRTMWRLPRAASASGSSNGHIWLPLADLSAEVFKKAVGWRIWSMGRVQPIRPLIRKQLKAPPRLGKMGHPDASAC